MKKHLFFMSVAIMLLSTIVSFGQKSDDDSRVSFDLVRSLTAQNAPGSCLANASGNVTITKKEGVERMKVEVTGLPANTDFDFFVIQVPNAPFGMAWYQGDIKTDDDGNGSQTFAGRFNVETFVVAQGSAAAPVVHTGGAFPDAAINPVTEPIHMFHLGLWFDSPTDAANAGCPAAQTRFNGDHNAGVQAMSTRNFANDQGPLRLVP
jgi:hypothetical protein